MIDDNSCLFYLASAANTEVLICKASSDWLKSCLLLSFCYLKLQHKLLTASIKEWNGMSSENWPVRHHFRTSEMLFILFTASDALTYNCLCHGQHHHWCFQRFYYFLWVGLKQKLSLRHILNFLKYFLLRTRWINFIWFRHNFRRISDQVCPWWWRHYRICKPRETCWSQR